MSVQVRARREAASFLASYVGAQGELLVDTSNNRVQVHDGATPGGAPAAKLSEVVTNTRSAVADAAYTALASDRTIAVTSLTAARSITLPSAAAYPTGTQLLVFDESGACSAINTISIARAGSDTINGASSAVISTAYGYLAFESNGLGKWTIIDQTAVATASSSRTPVADSNYGVNTSDRLIGYASLSAARTVTLPAAAAYPVGTRLLVLDESGAASATNTITLARVGSDTINGAATATISTAYGYIAVQSNGASKWTVTDQVGASPGAPRTPVADANYVATAADRLVAFTALTAARTVTLPAASAFPTGAQLFVVDETGACSASSTITLARGGSDTINGATSAVIATAYGYLALESNGSGKWTLIDQTPAAGGAAAPRSAVRQTVQGGPAASGAPSFLPASSGSLSLTAQNISTGVNALTVAAAQGHNATGPNDVVIQITSNPTWSSLAASTTVYLHVNAATGATGSTTSAPVYQFGGTPSTANGQFTFDHQAMVGYLGNGTSAVPTPLVFVGEAATSASAVASTIAYAYNGTYVGAFANGLPGGNVVAAAAHNLGTTPSRAAFYVEATAADAATGYAIGDGSTGILAVNSGNSYLFPPAIMTNKYSASLANSSINAWYLQIKSGTNAGNQIQISSNANFKWRFSVSRGWGGA